MMQNRAAKARPNPHVQRLARKGRMGDTEIGHLTAGEVVVPKKVWENDPSLATHATMAMAQAGLDPQQYVVGSPRNSRNPKTGAREFALQYTDQGWIDPSAGYNSPIDFSTYNPNGGGNQQAPEQSQATSLTPGTSKNYQGFTNAQLPSRDPAPGSDAYYAARAESWNNPAPSQQQNNPFNYDGQVGQSAQQSKVYNPQGQAQPSTSSNLAMPTATNEWGIPQNQGVNQQIAQATGYSGAFGSGDFDKWAQSQATPQQQLQASTILQNAGQANRITWGTDYNGNGAVEGTEAPGVQQNDDGTFTFPGGYIKGNHLNPFTSGNPIYQGNPNALGAPPAYAYGGGMLQAGAYPSDFMDAKTGVTTYNAAPPPLSVDAKGVAHWQNDAYVPWDVRNGGTGDPYTPYTKDWAAQQAAAGNGYAAGSLGSDAASLIPGANAGNIGSIRQGSGTAEGAAAAQPKPLGAFGGGRMWQYPDGSIVSDEGYLLQPTGNGLYFDTGRGVLRNGTGMIVNADGSPLTTEYSKTGHFDFQRVFGGDANTKNLAWLGGRDMNELNPGGREQPIIGPYGSAYGLTPTTIPKTGALATAGAAGAVTNPYTPPTTGTTGGTTTTGTPTTTTGTPTTTTGNGLTPGTANPYSFLNFFIGGQQGQNGTTPAGTTPSFDLNTFMSLLNSGYLMNANGYPTYTSAPADGSGGIVGADPNSEAVDFRSPFAYL